MRLQNAQVFTPSAQVGQKWAKNRQEISRNMQVLQKSEKAVVC
jgi:hypothetical protein